MVDVQNSFESLWEGRHSTIAKDLKLNFTKYVFSGEGALSAPDAWLAVLAAAAVQKDIDLMTLAQKALAQLDLTGDQIQEAAEVAGILGMVNTYYSFRDKVKAPEYQANAGLRMLSFSKPVLGKERFELLAFTASVLNGCEPCIQSHEKVLKSLGVHSDKIHDLARIASIVKGIAALRSIPFLKSA